MKKPFLAGLAILLPIAVTLFLIAFIVDFLTDPFVGMIEDLITRYTVAILSPAYKYLLVFASRLIVLIFFFLFILILGMLGRKLFFSWCIKWVHRIFYKIPIIKTIYTIACEVSRNLFSQTGKSPFKGTVAVPFPNNKAKALGLLTGKALKEVDEKKRGLQTVFVPTSPHPISGFLMMYTDQEIEKKEIKTEDLFKFLLSCGMYHPNEEQ